MIKKFFSILLFFIFIMIELFSQQLTFSPYSRYGIGELVYQGNLRSLSMGKTGLGQYNPYHINKINPASYGVLKPNTVIFELSFFDRLSFFSTQTDKQQNNITNVRTIFGAFPVFSWWKTSFGLLPYSAMGYRVDTKDSISAYDVGAAYTNSSYGYGGLNEFFWGNSFSYKHYFHFGFNLSYLFGSENRFSTINIDEEYSGFKSNLVFERRSLFNGFKYDLGFILYDTIFKNQTGKSILNASIGGVLTNKQTVNVVNTKLITRSVRFINRTRVDTFYNDTISENTLTIPLKYGLGVSFKLFEQFEISADYMTEKWQGLEFFGESNFADSKFTGIGMEYCRQANSTRFWRTIRYRLGAYQYDKYTVFNGEQLSERAITFGLGIPIRKFMFNFGFVLGEQGTYTTGLKENFMEFHFSFTLYDIWFVKRKFL